MAEQNLLRFSTRPSSTDLCFLLYSGTKNKLKNCSDCETFFFGRNVIDVFDKKGRYSASVCALKGIEYTSPTICSAISNLTPAFTFVFAVAFRFSYPFSSTVNCYFQLPLCSLSSVLTFSWCLEKVGNSGLEKLENTGQNSRHCSFNIGCVNNDSLQGPRDYYVLVVIATIIAFAREPSASVADKLGYRRYFACYWVRICLTVFHSSGTVAKPWKNYLQLYDYVYFLFGALIL